MNETYDIVLIELPYEQKKYSITNRTNESVKILNNISEKVRNTN